jgi:uncharacterized protein (DUF1810 family)
VTPILDPPGGAVGDADDLRRFVTAQEGAYPQALEELRLGRKRGHWMWFIFPQLRGLGRSETARHYGIASLEEAEAYLRHPLLGGRLRHCIGTVNGIASASAVEIFGETDAMKLRSCATLFRRAGGGPAFDETLRRFFSSRPDGLTLAILDTGR